MSVTINGTNGLVFPDASTQNTAATGFGFKNRIINGAMMIDQRNAGASVTPQDTYTLDRWVGNASAASKYTVQQNAGSVTPPIGFINYFGITSSSAYSVAAGETYAIQQRIEGLNISDLGWGTANASAMTLSFWVRSSLTGTFGGALRNSASDRSYPFSYTISSASTWEQKSITIPGDTTGTWLTTNEVGLRLTFGIGVGSTFSGTAGSWAGADYRSATGATSVVGTNGATFYITGVQLEKGSTATSFDYRPYPTELALCQRYYYKMQNTTTGNPSFAAAFGISSNAMYGVIYPPVQMRIAPSTAEYSQPRVYVFNNATAYTVGTYSLGTNSTSTSFEVIYTQGGVFTLGWIGVINSNSATGYIAFPAEL